MITVGKLREPTGEVALRMLREVGFADRLEGFSLRERAGAIPVTMYSFQEIVSLLNEAHPRLDFNELEAWIRRTACDQELAEEIAKIVSTGRNDRERTLRIKRLMEERLNQCKKQAGRA